MTAPDPVDEERVRVVVATVGDGEDRAAVTVARGLRDAGMEVVYAGRLQTAEQLADTVVQEDADAIGLPVPPADAALLARLAALLTDRGGDDVVVFACGPDVDLPDVARVFPPGSQSAEIAGWLRGRIGG